MKKEKLIEIGLGEIFPYLPRLSSESRFSGGASTTQSKIKPAIRQHLETALTGDEVVAYAAEKVRFLVRHELGISKRQN